MHEFQALLNEDKPVVAEFAATWCTPCALMIPVLKEIKEKVGDRVSIVTVDIDKEAHFAQSYNVLSVPTIILFHNGEVLWRRNGLTSANEILSHLNLCIE